MTQDVKPSGASEPFGLFVLLVRPDPWQQVGPSNEQDFEPGLLVRPFSSTKSLAAGGPSNRTGLCDSRMVSKFRCEIKYLIDGKMHEDGQQNCCPCTAYEKR